MLVDGGFFPPPSMTGPFRTAPLVPRRTGRLAITGLIVLVASAVAHASVDDRPAPAATYTLDAWYADDGLPQQMVTASAQTGDGYLWLGTEGGLARFDGARFATFDRRNTPALAAGGRIAALATAPDGSLWIGTDADGLLHLTGGRFERRWPTAGRASRVRDIAITRDGVVWIATPDGLVRIDRDTTRMFGPAEGLGTNSPRSVFVDPTGTLFVGSRGAVHRLRDGRFEVAARLPEVSVIGFTSDREGALWIGT
jgi:ligand-binding sensor domain-containing protein